jgi:hypothetical protein
MDRTPNQRGYLSFRGYLSPCPLSLRGDGAFGARCRSLDDGENVVRVGEDLVVAETQDLEA